MWKKPTPIYQRRLLATLMNKGAAILGFIDAALLHPLSAGQLDEVAQTVAFLKDQVPIIESVNGEPFEVWLKHPKLGIAFQKTLAVTGSGFFVASERVLYLVTAKHVATNMSNDCEVTVKGENRKPITLHLLELQGTNKTQLTWIHHPDIDLSIHPMIISAPSAFDVMRGHALSLANLKTNSLAPSRDITLATVGFPLGLGVQSEFSPISKESKAASGVLDDGKFGFFFMQDPAISGFSGAPVFELGDPRVIASTPTAFAIVTGGTGCWGLISATFSDSTGGKMAKVIPGRYIFEMIMQFEVTVTFVDGEKAKATN